MKSQETLENFLKDELNKVHSILQSALKSNKVIHEFNLDYYNVKIDKSNDSVLITTILSDDEPAMLTLDELQSYLAQAQEF